MDTKELIVALDKLLHELNLADQSIANRCKNNPFVTIEDLHFLHDFPTLDSLQEYLSQSSAKLRSTIYGCCRLLTRNRNIPLHDEPDDNTIYSYYRLEKVGVHATFEPASEIIYAVEALCNPTPPLCHKRGPNSIPTPIEFKNGTKLHFHHFNVPTGLEDAVPSDDVAVFCLGMDISGKRLSQSLLLYLMQKRCVNILDHLIRADKKLPGVYPPENLLLTVLYEMDGCPLLPIIKAIEETFPGTIKSAEDASCRNALWYTLRHHSQVHHVNFCCALDIENVEQYLLSNGCDPAKPSTDRFSWQTMIRLMNIIERYETVRHIA